MCTKRKLPFTRLIIGGDSTLSVRHACDYGAVFNRTLPARTVVVYVAAARVRVCVCFRAKTQLYGVTHGRRRGGANSTAAHSRRLSVVFFSRTPRTVYRPRGPRLRYTAAAPRRLPRYGLGL